ncbi:hypothetical protein EV426DRAFT_605285 [Tirmania nivea]|nr:hypothetical protein EV426DRAFT_605285 [Tirmania nivea]
MAIYRHGNKVAAVCVTLTFCMLTLLVARLYTRKYVVKSFGADDIFMCMGGIVCALLLPGIIIGIYKYEFGFTPETARPTSITAARIITYINMILLQVGLGLTKASLMLTVRRFARSSLIYIYFIQAMVITVLIFTVASTLILTIGCHPIRVAWEDAGPNAHGKCPGVRTYFIIMFVHMATDFITLLLPMPLLLTVKLPLLHKTFLIFCFTLGSISVAASVLRLYAILKATSHVIWNFLALEPLLWQVVEADVAVICGCLPPLNAFIRSYLFKRTYRHTITPEIHTPRPARPTSFASGLGVSSQALNWQDAGTWDGYEQTGAPYNGSMDLELSSLESSSRRTTEGLCLECVDSYERCRKHHFGIVDRERRPRSRSPEASKAWAGMDDWKRPRSCGELGGSRRRGMHQQQASWSP